MPHSEAHGGCLCGAIRYTLRGEAESMGLCYCKSCQRETGTSCLNFLWIKEHHVSLTGQLHWYTTIGGSGNPVRRGFCPTCGSVVMGKPEVVPNMCSIMAGSLDDSSIFKPTVALWTSEAPAWVTIDPSIHQFKQNPERS